jgi:hypothetical protein
VGPPHFCGIERSWEQESGSSVRVTKGQFQVLLISVSQQKSMQSACNKCLLKQIWSALLCIFPANSTNWKVLCNSVSEPIHTPSFLLATFWDLDSL